MVGTFLRVARHWWRLVGDLRKQENQIQVISFLRWERRFSGLEGEFRVSRRQVLNRRRLFPLIYWDQAILQVRGHGRNPFSEPVFLFLVGKHFHGETFTSIEFSSLRRARNHVENNSWLHDLWVAVTENWSLRLQLYQLAKVPSRISDYDCTCQALLVEQSSFSSGFKQILQGSQEFYRVR